MSLKLHSTFSDVDERLRSLDRDDNVNATEFQGVRDAADQFLAQVPGLDADARQQAAKDAREGADDKTRAAAQAALDFQAAVDGFQKVADDLVEATQKLALTARKAKLSATDRQRLQQAGEYQLGYVIAGYQSSLQRL